MATPRLVTRKLDFDSSEHLTQAFERLSAGDNAAGGELLVEACRRYPRDPISAQFLGILYYNLRRFDDAVGQFSRAAQLAPGVSAYAYNEGSALLMAGRRREALPAYLRSLHGDEMFHDAHRWAWSTFEGAKLPFVLRRLRDALRHDEAERHFESIADPADLHVVTLCAVDCVDPHLAARSLHRSAAQCRFGAVKLFTSQPCRHDAIETVLIDPITSGAQYSHFVMKELAQYVDTELSLVTQWDGYVVNAKAWCDEFVEYDYIGATWDAHIVQASGAPPSHNVGNGGFSLRSKRLLQAGSDPWLAQTHPEDACLCRTYRAYLEQRHAIRFAEAAIADRFAFEANMPDDIPFGFHGVFNICCFQPDASWMRFEFLEPADLLQ
jgi:tetratricopeptide (TPR) repeat protein